MKFTITNQEDLSKKLALNIKATSTNQLVESLKNIKIKIEGDIMELVSFNGENCIISSIGIKNQEQESFEFLIDGTTLKSIIDKFIEFSSKEINVTIDKNKNNINFSYKGINFNLKYSLELKDFNGAPNLDTYNDYKTVVFNKNQLRRAFLNTQKCASKDQTRPILEAISIVVKNEIADIVALDGYRLALNSISCESADDFRVSLSASNSMPILTEILKFGYDFVEVNSNGTYTMIENDDCIVFLKQIPEELPNYKMLLTKKEGYSTITLNKKSLEGAVNATKIGTKGNLATKMCISKDGSFVIKGINNSFTETLVNDFEIPLEAKFESSINEDVEIAFNSLYFLDLLNSIYTENCCLTVGTSVAPFFIENDNDNNSSYLLLPIRLK